MKKLCLALSICLLLVSCSNDDNPNSGRIYGYTLQVTGDIEAEKIGVANFSLVTLGGANSWELNMFDLDPQSMSLQLAISSNTQVIQRPEPGTYTIGDVDESNSVFTAIYVELPEGDINNAEQYNTKTEGYGGTLVIEASDSGIVTGNFNFTAAQTDENGNVVKEITVNGDFEALRSGL